MAISDSILSQADMLLLACKKLNYRRILDHDPNEIAKLQAILKELTIEPMSSDGLVDYAEQPAQKTPAPTPAPNPAPADQTDDPKEVQLARRKQVLEYLRGEGFGDRVGKVYNSFASTRSIHFREVPHRRGLPSFDMVVAPDYAPVAGLHGIFITKTQVLSMVLASDAGTAAQWDMLKCQDFYSVEQMTELVTLLSAGFELP